MAFRLDDIIIDRIQMGVAEDFSGNLLYTLTQLADANINISAESKDAVDAQGKLIKRFWQGKQGEFTANNAMLNLNIVASASGDGKVVATTESPINMPGFVTVKAGASVELKNFVEDTVKVCVLYANGTMGDSCEVSVDAATDTEYFMADATLSAPLKEFDEDGRQIQYLVKYDRKVTEGAYVANKADKFPDTIKLTLKALCVDPCSADTLRACYIVFPSFQPSPELEISLTTDGQLAYSGALQVDYCSLDKVLYEIYICADDEENED